MSIGWGDCNCCGVTWNFVEGKNFMYSDYQGTFPICKMCFDELVDSDKYDEINKYYTNSVLRNYGKKEVNRVLSEIEKEIGKDRIRNFKICKII